MLTNNIFNMHDTTVLVTGATGYLGKEMCLGLAEAGAKVLVNSRSRAKADTMVMELCKLGFNAESAAFDVTQVAEVEAFFENYQGSLTVIINNAYAGGAGTIEHSQPSDFTSAYQVTVESANNLFQLALPLLRKSVKDVGYSSIINISSMYGCVSPDLNLYSSPESSNPPFYGAAKAALLQWSKYGACEFGKEGIRFNSISPGPFPNTMHNSNEFLSALGKKVPLGRVGAAVEIRGPIVFLASKASSFVNGTNLAVDGGWTSW